MISIYHAKKLIVKASNGNFDKAGLFAGKWLFSVCRKKQMGSGLAT